MFVKTSIKVPRQEVTSYPDDVPPDVTKVEDDMETETSEKETT